VMFGKPAGVSNQSGPGAHANPVDEPVVTPLAAGVTAYTDVLYTHQVNRPLDHVTPAGERGITTDQVWVGRQSDHAAGVGQRLQQLL
jgi:hypothetical protein